jgi:predicted phage baseplate assembly protein
MSLPTPLLDDRRFQDIVDEAKSRIPRYCQEWTDHNVSDPGVAVIELFAWMTDLLLYRVNQVPDKLYITLLDLIGIQLEPARAARVPVTLYLSAPQPNDLTIPEGTEVATVRTETSPAIVFTSEADLTIRVVELQGVFTRGGDAQASWNAHDVRRMQVPDYVIPMFSSPPVPGDALYLGLRRDHSRHVLAVHMACDQAAGAGVVPEDPPLAWQAWQGNDGGWVDCDVEYDGTRGLNVTGDVILHTPAMAEGVVAGQRGWWLRCLLKEPRRNQPTYYAPPSVGELVVTARGGTVGARHAVTVHDEVLGRSDGTPGQTFTLLNTPLLARDPRRDHLIVEPTSGPGTQPWTEVEDFAESGEDDPHYTLDSLTGVLSFGPSLLQPDGTVYRFGATPPKGSRLRFARYQYGGGVAGNAPRGALGVLKSSIPYVARVTNRDAAAGGLDAESLEHAKLRAPQVLRSRTRAVTGEDYEYLACQVPGVARAYCLAPGVQPGSANDPPPGTISILILPTVDEHEGQIAPEQLALTQEIARSVQEHLDTRRLLGTTLEVRAPRLAWVAVSVTLRVPERTEPAVMDAVRIKGEQALYRYLNPFVGGPEGTGWPLGRDLNRSELFGLLQQIQGVDYADELRIMLVEPNSSTPPRTASQRLVVAHDALMCSARHEVKVDFVVDD